MKTLAMVAAVVGMTIGAMPVFSADEQATEKLLKSESLGGLRLELPAKAVIKLLGEPTKRGESMLQEADGNYVQDWDYPAKGIEITMSAGGKKGGPQTVFSLTASAPCALPTKAGIKIGSAESEVRKAYGAFADRDTPADPDSLIVGSIYGGIIFNFEQGKVSRIFFGAAAE